MAKSRDKMTAPGCKEVELDLTDYITGDMTFLTKAKQVKLFAHLRACADCRSKFWSWNETYSVIKGKHQSARPEFRQRMDALIEQFKKEYQPVVDFVPQGVPLNMAHEIGSPAGKVWQALASNGVIRREELPQKTGLDPALAYGAMGWLAHENKLCMVKHEDHYDLFLPVSERQQAGV